MTLTEIHMAVRAGKKVCWATSNYEVICDSIGQWLIRSKFNNHCVGLTEDSGLDQCYIENRR
jgi:hypothetical protein